MDPNEVLRLIRQAIIDGDEGEACGAFRDLDTWLVSGGAFPSDWTNPRSLMQDVADEPAAGRRG